MNITQQCIVKTRCLTVPARGVLVKGPWEVDVLGIFVNWGCAHG
jgi:hypothetical protein